MSLAPSRSNSSCYSNRTWQRWSKVHSHFHWNTLKIATHFSHFSMIEFGSWLHEISQRIRVFSQHSAPYKMWKKDSPKKKIFKSIYFKTVAHCEHWAAGKDQSSSSWTFSVLYCYYYSVVMLPEKHFKYFSCTRSFFWTPLHKES